MEKIGHRKCPECGLDIGFFPRSQASWSMEIHKESKRCRRAKINNQEESILKKIKRR